MSLRKILSDYWCAFQQEPFPRLEGALGPKGERYERFVAFWNWCGLRRSLASGSKEIRYRRDRLRFLV